MSCFLGIDLGTSECKAVVVDVERGAVVAAAGQPLTVQRPQPGWSEQTPADWWQACDAALSRLRADAPQAMAAVQAIGLAGQMHGAVVLDAADQVLRPAILWNDGRSAAQCAALEAAWPQLHAVTGNRAMPGFTAPKLMWLREHERALFDRIACVLLPKDWLRLQLSGEKASDMSDASGSLWLDVAQRAWSDAALAATSMQRAQMPRLVEGSAVAGTLRPALAARWGLRAGLPVAGGGGDNAASAVGIGAVRAGSGFVSLGTSGVVFVVGETFKPNPRAGVHAFCHALPATWHQMSVMLSAASALRWARELLGLPSEAALLERVAALSDQQRAAAPIFLPYLSGERTPHNDAQAQGVLFGLSAEHDAAALGWAVIEGVAFGLRDGYDALGGAASGAQTLSLVGGGARSTLWAEVIASALGVALVTHEGGEAGGAIGAARLAALACGAGLADACPPPAVRERFEPAARMQAVLDQRLQRFRALYPALQARFADRPQ